MIIHFMSCLKFLLFERDYCWLFFHFSFFDFKPLSFRNIASNLINGTLPSQLKHLEGLNTLYELVLFEEDLISYHLNNRNASHNLLSGRIDRYEWLCPLHHLDLRDNLIECPLLSCCSEKGNGYCVMQPDIPCYSPFSPSPPPPPPPPPLSTPPFSQPNTLSSSLVIVIVIFVFGLILIGVLYWLKRRKDRNSVLIIDWEEEEEGGRRGGRGGGREEEEKKISSFVWIVLIFSKDWK